MNNISTEQEKPKSVKGAHILVIDDDPELLELIADTLKDFDFVVTAISNSEEALRTFAEQPAAFDLVISDNYMPGLRGTTLLQAMRQVRDDIPLVLITGDNSLKSPQYSNLLVLAKPFDDEELVSLIRRALEKKYLH